MDLSTLANALTVLTGVAFGLIEMRREREERAALAAVQALDVAQVDELLHNRRLDP